MPTIPFGINRSTKQAEHISEATKINKYVCCVCKQPLQIRDGEVKEKHFAHFYPQEECILRTVHQYENDFEKSGGKLKSGIEQNFDDWMEYIRAVERGNLEAAATLWDFDLEASMEITVIPQLDLNEIELIPQLNPKQDIPTFTTWRRDESEESKLKRVANLSDGDLEWITRQAALKPILDGMVHHCPIARGSIIVDRCALDCEYFQEVRQPMVDPDKPNVVVCRGHHQVHQVKEQYTLFEY